MTVETVASSGLSAADFSGRINGTIAVEDLHTTPSARGLVAVLAPHFGMLVNTAYLHSVFPGELEERARKKLQTARTTANAGIWQDGLVVSSGRHGGQTFYMLREYEGPASTDIGWEEMGELVAAGKVAVLGDEVVVAASVDGGYDPLSFRKAESERLLTELEQQVGEAGDWITQGALAAIREAGKEGVSYWDIYETTHSGQRANEGRVSSLRSRIHANLGPFLPEGHDLTSPVINGQADNSRVILLRPWDERPTRAQASLSEDTQGQPGTERKSTDEEIAKARERLVVSVSTSLLDTVAIAGTYDALSTRNVSEMFLVDGVPVSLVASVIARLGVRDIKDRARLKKAAVHLLCEAVDRHWPRNGPYDGNNESLRHLASLFIAMNTIDRPDRMVRMIAEALQAPVPQRFREGNDHWRTLLRPGKKKS